MKKLKNAMLLIVGGLVAITTITTTSCKKDTPVTTAKPAISSAANANGTVGTAFTYNITASNTPTSYNATGLPAGLTVSTSTGAITGTPTAAGVSTVAISATNAGGTGTATLTITITTAGPVLTSDNVAAANLIAHWTFDGNSKEFYSNQSASSTVGADFTTAGQIGNCANFTNGYLLYANGALAQLHDTTLESYSISMWVNIPTAPGNGTLRSLLQINPTTYPDIWGAVSLSLNNNGAGTDTLPLRADQVQVSGRGPQQATASSNFAGGEGKWTFITETYDGNGNNQTMKLFANGIMIDSTQFNNVDKPETFRITPGGGPAFVGTPTDYVSIGTLAFLDRGNTLGDGYGNSAPNAIDRPWAGGNITGKIDDIRLFNRPLTTIQVDSLYAIGLTGK